MKLEIKINHETYDCVIDNPKNVSLEKANDELRDMVHVGKSLSFKLVSGGWITIKGNMIENAIFILKEGEDDKK